jgi:hypothetical protein
MQAIDELLTIAELAIGLSGFSAVVVSFTHRGGLREVDRFSFVALLTTAGTAIVLSFAPFLFNHAGLVGPALWACSSAVMLVLWVVVAASMVSRSYRIGLWSSMPLGRPAAAAMGGIPMLNLPLQIGNVVGWPMDPGPLLYVIGLLLWLAVAGMLFAYLVLVGAEE